MRCRSRRRIGRRWVASFAAHSEDADEEGGEDGLEADGGEGCAGDDPAHGVGVVESAEGGEAPLVDGDGQEDEAEDEGDEAEDQAALEVDELEEFVEARVGGHEAFGDGEEFCEDGELDGLIAAENGEAGEEEG